VKGKWERMGLKVVSGLMLTLLLVSMVFVLFDVPVVVASGTIYIRADGSIDPLTAPVSFNSAYGGDPGRDWVMGTDDDLDYFPVLIAARDAGISFLTVDCQYGQIWPGYGPLPISMQEDAHANFINIANYTDGVCYNYTMPDWDTAIVAEIKKRIGTGPGDVVFTFDLSGSFTWDENLFSDLQTRTIGIVAALATLNVGFGLGTHVDYPCIYDPQTNYNYTGWIFSSYGNPEAGDYPWLTNQDITLDRTLIINAISGISPIYDGRDIPQDYTRVVYETQFFNWRPGAKRIVVMYGDAPAHSAPSGLSSPPYTIRAYCDAESAYVNVSITMDGIPTGYTTSHTFTGLNGTHTFTVPSTDANSHPFNQWSTGNTSTTITVSSGGTYTAYYGIHDIAVTDVTPSKTVVGQGYSLNINVTVENQGDCTETFGIVAPYFEGVISPSSENWKTFWSMGDVNLDGYINQTDVNIILYNWGWHGPPGENTADVTSDGWVDGKDMAQCVNYQGENIWSYFGLPLPPKGTQRGARLYYPGSQTTLTFTWNTTGFVKGNYTISAYAWPVLGEIDAMDNNCTDGWILLAKVGDFGSAGGFFAVDGLVDGYDLSLFIQAYNGLAGEAMYICDLGDASGFFKTDENVDAYDLTLFIQCYNELGPPDP